MFHHGKNWHRVFAIYRRTNITPFRQPSSLSLIIGYLPVSSRPLIWQCHVNNLADPSNDITSDDSNCGQDSSDRKTGVWRARVRAAIPIAVMKYNTPGKQDNEQNMQ